jgi:DNA-binding NtrC family response regulator
VSDIVLPKILCVDDEPFLLAALARALRRRFSVSKALGAEEALRILAQEGPFVAVITDLSMPGTDGIALLRRVRETSPETMRILLSGHGPAILAERGVEAGLITRLFCKPCSIDLLADAIAGAGRPAASQVSLDQTLMNRPQPPI